MGWIVEVTGLKVMRIPSESMRTLICGLDALFAWHKFAPK